MYFTALTALLSCSDHHAEAAPATDASVSEPDPVLSQYTCVAINDYPWLRHQDIRQDGRFDGEDLVARAYNSYTKSSGVKHTTADLEGECTRAQFSFVGDEAMWRFKSLLLTQNTSGNTESPLVKGIQEREILLLDKLDDLQTSSVVPTIFADRPARDVFQHVSDSIRSRVIEMSLRAQKIASGNGLDEPFGVGLAFQPVVIDATTWGFKITDVHPNSSAERAGILIGDTVLAVDDRAIKDLSTDHTFSGILDPRTQMARGFGGDKDSLAKLKVVKDGTTSTVELTRNVWSGRSMGHPIIIPTWDGTEAK